MRKILLAGAALTATSARAVTIGFDDAEALLYDRSNQSTASVLDSRYNGMILSYVRGVDAFGNLDPYVPVTAVGYADYPGLTPVSGVNALDGFLGSVVVDLNPAVFPRGSAFAINVVDQGFGNENAKALVFDATGAQIDSVAMDLSRPGRFAYSAKPFASIQLPQGAYYDDLTIMAAPVPEPASFTAVAVGLVGLARRRR